MPVGASGDCCIVDPGLQLHVSEVGGVAIYPLVIGNYHTLDNGIHNIWLWFISRLVGRTGCAGVRLDLLAMTQQWARRPHA